MERWKLTLLGGFSLVSPNGKECNSLGKRERALLAYLSLTPNQRENRDRLAALLWSNRGEEQARHSLAQSTASLRKALQDDSKSTIVSEPNAIALAPDAFEIDVIEFQRLVQTASLQALEHAVRLYRDDLLPAFDLRSEGFDEWISVQRERLRNQAVEAACRLAEAHAEAGNWPEVVKAASKALEMDNLREVAHRLLIAAYAHTGSRALALRQYNVMADLLERELQVDPDSESDHLIDAIRSGRIPGGDSGSPDVRGMASEAFGNSTEQRANPGRWKRLSYWALAVTAALVVTTAVAITAIFWRVPELAPSPISDYVREIKSTLQPHPLSIAVLTFESHGDADATDFAEAISGGMITALSISSEMRVISRSEARRQEEQRRWAFEELARELQARYFLEGSVNKWGNRIIVEVGLVDARQGAHRIWSESYAREVNDFAQFQQDVIFDVIRSLEIRLTEGEQERINRVTGTRNLNAWLAAARGEKHMSQLTPKEVMIARRSYERALELDPRYPGAMEGLAWTYLIEARFGWTGARQEALEQAKRIAAQALELDPDRPLTFSLLGSISLLEGDYQKAVELGEKAYSLNPNDSDVAALLAYTLTYTGEPERALSLIRRAIDLRPNAPHWYDWLKGRAHRVAGRPGRAIEILSAAVRQTPNSPLPLIELAAAYGEAGETALAERTAREILRLNPRFTVSGWTTLNLYRNADARSREAATLRAAGLPD